LFHAMQSGIEGAFFDAQDVVGDALDVEGNAVAVHGPAKKGLEDEESESALEDVGFGFGGDRAPLDSFYRQL
jgi:hypothetical protein